MLLLRKNLDHNSVNATSAFNDVIPNLLSNAVEHSNDCNETLFFFLPSLIILTGLVSFFLILVSPMLVMTFDDPKASERPEPYIFIATYMEVTYTLSKITIALIRMFDTRRNTFLKFLGYRKGSSIILFIVKHLIYGLVIPISIIYGLVLVQFIVEKVKDLVNHT